jgi:hypothetical protein
VKHPSCTLCGVFVRVWWHRHAPVGSVRGWRCLCCELFFCDVCAPQTGEGKHDEMACFAKHRALP